MVGRSSCIDLVIELSFCLVSRALRFGFAVQLLWCTFWLETFEACAYFFAST